MRRAGCISGPTSLGGTAGECLFVGDAKYKRVEVQHVPNADLYQLLAYVTALGLPGGLLIYAKGEDEPVMHHIRHSGKRLEVAALDLSGTLEDVLARVDNLAGDGEGIGRQSAKP